MIPPSGIVNLSEAARSKRWGSRWRLSGWVKLGLPGRRIGNAFFTTTDHLDAFVPPKRGRPPIQKT